MASEASFEGLPPFPRDLDTLSLPKISLKKLSDADQAAEATIFSACCRLGFFLLDLRDGDDALGKKMMLEIDQLFLLSQRCFNLEYDEKMKYHHDMPRDLLGYKGRGETKTDTGKLDRHEFFAMGMDEMLGSEPPRANVPPIEESRPLIRRYLEHGRLALLLILRALARQLGLPQETLCELHSHDRPSGTKLRFLQYGKSELEEDLCPSLIGHTDWGSVTLLANNLGGLQVLDPETDHSEGRWYWVRPEPGCLIVNLGDAMVEWTGGVLRSNLHRVTYSPGEQRYVDRLSIALAFRPYKTANMTRLDGGIIPTIEQDKKDGINASLGQISVNAYEWEVQKGIGIMRGEEITKSRGGRMFVKS